MFAIEDERHWEVIGNFHTHQQAIEALRNLASLPWDHGQNKPPCTTWKQCGRRYQLVEYEGEWLEISRTLMLEISADTTRWH